MIYSNRMKRHKRKGGGQTYTLQKSHPSSAVLLSPSDPPLYLSLWRRLLDVIISKVSTSFFSKLQYREKEKEKNCVYGEKISGLLEYKL